MGEGVCGNVPTMLTRALPPAALRVPVHDSMGAHACTQPTRSLVLAGQVGEDGARLPDHKHRLPLRRPSSCCPCHCAWCNWGALRGSAVASAATVASAAAVVSRTCPCPCSRGCPRHAAAAACPCTGLGRTIPRTAFRGRGRHRPCPRPCTCCPRAVGRGGGSRGGRGVRVSSPVASWSTLSSPCWYWCWACGSDGRGRGPRVASNTISDGGCGPARAAARSSGAAAVAAGSPWPWAWPCPCPSSCLRCCCSSGGCCASAGQVGSRAMACPQPCNVRKTACRRAH